MSDQQEAEQARTRATLRQAIGDDTLYADSLEVALAELGNDFQRLTTDRDVWRAAADEWERRWADAIAGKCACGNPQVSTPDETGNPWAPTEGTP